MQALDILGGVRVIEIAEGIAGPAAGQQLADLGATVLKLEPPQGDRTRGWVDSTTDAEPGAIFAHLNRGKKSAVVDWSKEEDRAFVRDLLREADVAIVHLEAADRARAGIAWDGLAAQHPRLIVCEISDLGRQGPLAGLPGSELVIQSLSGYTRYAGNRDAPCRIGYEVASVSAGMHTVQAVLAMLYERGKSGRGDYCHISLLGQLLSLKSILMAAQSNPDAWLGFHLNGPHWPADIGWPTRDGQVTFDFRHGERDGWVAFCKAVGLDHLPDDPEYKDWRSTIYIGDRKASHGGPYRAAFAKMTSADASALVNKLGGISVKFHDYAEIVAHPQMQHVQAFVEVDGGMQVGTPFRFEGATVANMGPAPAPKVSPKVSDLGSDTAGTLSPWTQSGKPAGEDGVRVSDTSTGGRR